jgi:hypothetical protein
LAEELLRLNEENPEFEERKASMYENAEQAALDRILPLPLKYKACDPLPDPYNEKDMTSFMTLWAERPDKTLKEALDNCQIAEAVCQEM